MKMIKFPSIKQLRNIISDIKHLTHCVGLDENNKPIYDGTIKLPVIKFIGTVKLHGANCSIVFNKSSGYYGAQSREIILNENNHGNYFWQFAMANKEKMIEFLDKAYTDLNIPETHTVVVYGEWCGESIQKRVALRNLPRMFVAFDFIVLPQDETNVDNGTWHTDYIKTISAPENYIYNIYEFPYYELDIDFSNLAESQEKLTEITQSVEDECPVAKQFGVSGTGEGVVWKTTYKGKVLRFKVKGKEHKISDSADVAPVDIEYLASVQAFAEYAVTENRLQQGLDYLREHNKPLDKSSLGDYLRWIANDIKKEESDVIAGNNLDENDVNKKVNAIAMKWFKENIVQS